MKQLPVTVVIPARNAADTIEAAVHSAIAAGANYVMIYDDGSTDGTKRICAELCMTFHRVVEVYSCMQAVRGGVHFARNFLIELAYEGLIIPLDADDKLLSISPLVSAWRPGTWVYGDHIQIDAQNAVHVAGIPSGALPRKNITGVTFLFHSKDWEQVGGYDPDFAYAEDYAFQCALTHHNIKPVYVPSVVYERHLKPEGNERSILAGEHWPFYHRMARHKYPNVFQGG